MIQDGRLAPGTALITGAARRIGKAIALELANAGWRIAVHYGTSADDANHVVEKIISAGGKAVAVQADLAQESDVLSLVPRTTDALGPVTLLVNNASVFEKDDALGATRAGWDAHMETNLRAPFVLSQEMVRGLAEGQQGMILNIIDYRVWGLRGDFTSYTLSKYALWGLTQMMARSFAPHVRVNGIGPGPTLPSPRQTEEQFEAFWRTVPLDRPVDVQDICRAVRFLVDTPSLTGQMLALDSGQHMWASPAAGEGVLDE